MDIIDDVLKSINKSICRSTGMRPIDVTPENANNLWKRLYDCDKLSHKPPRFKKEDDVRIALEKRIFRKGYVPTFSDEIFKVDRVVKNDPNSPPYYYLRDHKNDPIEGRFYSEELTKTREDKNATYRIDRVLQKRRNKKGELEYRVQFVGYPHDTYWINESDFVN